MANLIRESIDRWFDNHLDLDNRTIYMGSIASTPDGYEAGVDHLMAEYFIKGIHVLEKKNHTLDVNIIMNNPGGDPYHGMAIYDAIRNSPCPCTIKVYGNAMSMGSVILQSADYRIMMPNSRFMIHYGYGMHENHVRTIENWVNDEKRFCYEIENIYLKMMLEKEEKEGHGYLADMLSKIISKQREFEYPMQPKNIKYIFSKRLETKREEVRVVLKEMLNFDTILNAEETVALGFADEVYKRPE